MTCALKSRIHLQPIPDHPWTVQETSTVRIGVRCNTIDIEAVAGTAKRCTFLEDRQPREARLIDLQHQALEELIASAQREIVFSIVVGAVVGIVPGRVAGHVSARPATYGSKLSTFLRPWDLQ